MYLLPLVVLLVFTALLIVIKKKVPTTSTLPSEAGLTTPAPEETLPLSRWATDSGVLEIEEKISQTEEKLDGVDLQEIKLQPPILDMDVSL